MFQYFRIRRLKKLIESEGDYVRAKAAEELGKTKSDMAIAPLIDAMRTNQSALHVHSAAIDALCQIRSRRRAQRVTSLLTDTDVASIYDADPRRSSSPSGILGRWDHCEPASKIGTPRFAVCAVDVLAAIGTPGAIEGIRRIMNDDDQGVRRRVGSALRRHGVQGRRRRNWRSSGPSTTEIARRLPPPGRPGSISSCPNSARPPRTKRNARRERKAAEAIEKAERTGSSAERIVEGDRVARGCGSCRHPCSWKDRRAPPQALPLAEAIEQHMIHYWEEALQVIASIGDRSAAEPLRKIVTRCHNSQSFGEKVCRALYHLGDASGVPALVRWLKEEDESTRSNCEHSQVTEARSRAQGEQRGSLPGERLVYLLTWTLESMATSVPTSQLIPLMSLYDIKSILSSRSDDWGMNHIEVRSTSCLRIRTLVKVELE